MKNQNLVCGLLLLASFAFLGLTNANVERTLNDDSQAAWGFTLPFPFISIGNPNPYPPPNTDPHSNPGFTLPFPFVSINIPPFFQFGPFPQAPPYPQAPPFLQFPPFPNPFAPPAPPTTPSTPKVTLNNPPTTPKNAIPASPTTTTPSNGDSPVVNSGGGGGFLNGKADSWWYRIHTNGNVETSNGFFDDPNVPADVLQMIKSLSARLKHGSHP